MHDWLTSNRKGIAIVRVSSGRQEGNLSHETQEAEITRYARENEIELVETYRIVESAKDSDNRSKYQAAIARALSTEIRHVLFYMADRETRNLTDNERNEKLVRADVLVLHYVRERKVLHRGSPDSDFVIRDVQAVFAKQFIRVHTAKVEDAMRRKAEQGWFPSSQTPLGYKPHRDADGKATVVVDRNEGNVKWVQREFELRARGMSYEEIRAHVISEGLVPAERIHEYRPKMVGHRTHNPFYWGRFKWKGIEYEGKHPRIIPDWILERVAKVERGRKVRVLDPSAEHGILSHGGFIRCVCGCAVVYDPKRKTYKTTGRKQVFHYYRCTNGKRAHQRHVYVREDVLWQHLEHVVDAVTLPPELAERIAHELNSTHRGALAEAARQIQEAKRRLKELREREDLATRHLLDGTLDREAYGRAREEIQSEQRVWQQKLEGAQFQATGRYHETAQSVVELCKRAKELYLSRSTGDRLQLLKMLLSNLLLDGLTVQINYRKPFSSLVDLKKTEEWWTRWNNFLTECASLQGGKFLGEPFIIRKSEDQGDR